MSDSPDNAGDASSPSSENSSVESLRRQAKQLVKAARSGDPAVIDAGQAAQFLQWVVSEHLDPALELLRAHPELASYSIHTAAAVGHVDAVRRFIAADPASATEITRPDNTAPIIYAVISDIKSRLEVDVMTRVELVRVLLDAGASPNTSVPMFNSDARIPVLFFPCAAGDTEVARLLLERGASGNDGESVYHAAEHNRRECLELLVQHGADISKPHASFGNTPLYFLAGYREDNHVIASVTAGMEWLLEHGADPNVFSTPKPSADGSALPSELPLHRIAASGRPASVARMFVEHGANIDTPRGDGRTAYAMAVRAGNTGVAEYLASVGADTSRVAPVDLLLGACAGGDDDLARSLVAAHPSLVASLTDEDAQTLNVAVGENRVDAVRVMLSLGWPVHVESEWGGTPLHWAAWRGRVALARDLIAHGAPINQRDSAYGSSPIAWACHGSTNAERDADEDYVAIVNMLLDAGATRAESYNMWNESPENMATPTVANVLKARGFAV